MKKTFSSLYTNMTFLKNLGQIKSSKFLNNPSNYWKMALICFLTYNLLLTIFAPKKVTFEWIQTQISEGNNVNFKLASYDVNTKEFLTWINDTQKAYFIIYLDDLSDYTKKLKEKGVELPKEKVSWFEIFSFYNYIDSFLYLTWFFAFLWIRSLLVKVARSQSSKITEKERPNVRFDEIKGIDNVKSELEEVVDHFRNSDRVKALGGTVLGGVLMHGSPGTGKTLMAKAVATETNSQFISLSGSQVVHKYVGEGAKKIRDIFTEARSLAKTHGSCVIFIDEIDAFALRRGSERSHSEYDQTVNELLTQMNGLGRDNTGILVIAATNRIENLDEALLRPGRFDRKIKVEKPSLQGRKEILKLYIDKIPKKSDDINIDILAKSTTYFSGADLKNLVDEAIYFAIRKNKEQVDMSDFMSAKDKIIMGADSDIKLSDEEKKMTAYHEVGHALISVLTKHREVTQVSIVPKGNALGVTQTVDEDKFSYSKKDWVNFLMMLFGGKVAEKIFFDHESTGASNDLKRATEIARNMVAQYGMGKKGPINVIHEYARLSDKFKYELDTEVMELLKEVEEKTINLLQRNRKVLDHISKALIEKETLNTAEFNKVLDEAVQLHGKNEEIS